MRVCFASHASQEQMRCQVNEQLHTGKVSNRLAKNCCSPFAPLDDKDTQEVVIASDAGGVTLSSPSRLLRCRVGCWLLPGFGSNHFWLLLCKLSNGLKCVCPSWELVMILQSSYLSEALQKAEILSTDTRGACLV